jgi:hypothetical protein
MANDKLIDSYAAAQILGYHVNVLFFAQKHGRGPKFELKQGNVAYRLSVIEEFALQQVPPDAIYYGPVIRKESSACAQDDKGRWRFKDDRQFALKYGDKRYFPGVKCERGHIAEWFTKNNQCTMCAEENRKRRNLKKALQRDTSRQVWNPNSKKHCEHTPGKDSTIGKVMKQKSIAEPNDRQGSNQAVANNTKN